MARSCSFADVERDLPVDEDEGVFAPFAVSALGRPRPNTIGSRRARDRCGGRRVRARDARERGETAGGETDHGVLGSGRAAIFGRRFDLTTR